MASQLLLFFIIVISISAYLLRKYLKGRIYLGMKPNLQGKIAIVTGGCGGIGFEIVKDLVKQGCYVIIADIGNGQKIIQQVNSTLKKPQVQWQYIDLGDLESIRNFVNLLKIKRIDQIDFLVNNAGVIGGPQLKYTKSKRQLHFGINYIGHFYLTHLLWRSLNKSLYFRIVVTSSIAHKKVCGWGRVVSFEFDKLNFENTIFDRDLAYSRSKLCLTMFSKALSEIIPPEKGLIASVHPGIIMTNLVNNMYSGLTAKLLNFSKFVTKYFMKNCFQGAQTSLYILYSDPKDIQSGSYYADCAKSQWNSFVQKNYKKLFQITEQSLGIKFGEQQL